MTRRDYWLIGAAMVVAILLHALVPRYDWRDPGGDDAVTYIRIDRWTGQAEIGRFTRDGWRPAREIRESK